MARPATRNLGRLSEIAQVLVRHGFGYMFERHRLTDILPWRERAAPLDGQPSSRGRALREALDELGPTFVKFGQLLSMRPDVLPPDIIAELRGLQDDVLVGRDGRLYLGSGSTCDVCRERDPRSAAVLSFRLDGSDARVVAHGLRNPYGLAVQPRTARLFASVNGQDELGDSEPAETIVVVRRGADYGWPRCRPSRRLLRLVGSCRGVTRPVAYLEPHSSADGIVFWRRDLYVAEWGEYASRRHGRKVVRLRFDRRGRPLARVATTFATGFDHPLALAVDPRGGLLLADWGTGRIYRIARAPRPLPVPPVWRLLAL